MPGLFIVFIIATVLALIALGVTQAAGRIARAADRTSDRQQAAAAAWLARMAIYGFAGLALLCGAVSSVTMVPANQVGIVTNFGAWHGTLEPGLSLTTPWSTVDTFTTRNQKSIRDNADGNYDCIRVKLAGGASACVDATVLYTIDSSRAENLWKGWGSFARLNEDLVNRSTDEAAGQVYGTHQAEDAVAGENRQKITEAITKLLEQKLKPWGVELGSVTLGDIHLPTDVQDRINRVLAATADTKIATQREQTAAAEGRANAALQQSLTPEALVKLCLEVARDAKPAVLNCWPATGSAPANVLVQPRQ